MEIIRAHLPFYSISNQYAPCKLPVVWGVQDDALWYLRPFQYSMVLSRELASSSDAESMCGVICQLFTWYNLDSLGLRISVPALLSIFSDIPDCTRLYPPLKFLLLLIIFKIIKINRKSLGQFTLLHCQVISWLGSAVESVKYLCGVGYP